jgi:hypothetical protein
MDSENYLPVNPNFYNYISKGLEKDVNRLINHISMNKVDINKIIICAYQVNNEGAFPFIQFLLYNNFGIPFLGNFFQELDFPMLEIQEKENNIIHLNAKEKIKYFLSTMYCMVDNLDHIKVKGFYNNNNQYYLFVDISKISITPVYLTKTSPVWFALTNEIMNNKNVCNIPISQTIHDLFSSEYKLFTITDLEKKCIKNPDIVYEGSHFKQTEFQSIFGISKKTNEQYYHLLYSINDAFKKGGWSSTGVPEFKFNKKLTDNECGRYISGGINRIALLSSCSSALNSDDIINGYLTFDDYDLATTVINNQPIAIIKDINQQVSLSYHKIDKKNMSDYWEPNNCYCIE